MNWWDGLGKDNRGSRPRCILLMDGTRKDVAKRLTDLVDYPGVVVSCNDKWMPYGKPVWKSYGKWDKEPSKEAQLDKSCLVECISEQLKEWWLATYNDETKTPTWDIASTCTIQGEQGLLLVEAKAHRNELDESGKTLSQNQQRNANSRKNHARIREAIIEANKNLKQVTTGPWDLSIDHHYQLSNRFAWAWKLAMLEIPVALVYLGFLNAEEMADRGPPFSTEVEWEKVLKKHCEGIVDDTCWGERLDIKGTPHIKGTPLIPLIRAIDQPFARH